MAILTADKIEKIAIALNGDDLFEGVVTPYHNVCVTLDRLAKSMTKSQFKAIAWDAINATNKRNRYGDIKNEIERFYSGESFTVQGTVCIVISKVCVSMFALCEGRNI